MKYYTVFENQDGKVIVCGKRPVLVMYANLETIADVLNDEIAPMIAALDEKSLENMQLHERIAELEAAFEAQISYEASIDFGEYDLSPQLIAANFTEIAEKALKKAPDHD